MCSSCRMLVIGSARQRGALILRKKLNYERVYVAAKVGVTDAGRRSGIPCVNALHNSIAADEEGCWPAVEPIDLGQFGHQLPPMETMTTLPLDSESVLATSLPFRSLPLKASGWAGSFSFVCCKGSSGYSGQSRRLRIP